MDWFVQARSLDPAPRQISPATFAEVDSLARKEWLPSWVIVSDEPPDRSELSLGEQAIETILKADYEPSSFAHGQSHHVLLVIYWQIDFFGLLAVLRTAASFVQYQPEWWCR